MWNAIQPTGLMPRLHGNQLHHPAGQRGPFWSKIFVVKFERLYKRMFTLINHWALQVGHERSVCTWRLWTSKHVEVRGQLQNCIIQQLVAVWCLAQGHVLTGASTRPLCPDYTSCSTNTWSINASSHTCAGMRTHTRAHTHMCSKAALPALLKNSKGW